MTAAVLLSVLWHVEWCERSGLWEICAGNARVGQSSSEALALEVVSKHNADIARRARPKDD